MGYAYRRRKICLGRLLMVSEVTASALCVRVRIRPKNTKLLLHNIMFSVRHCDDWWQQMSLEITDDWTIRGRLLARKYRYIYIYIYIHCIYELQSDRICKQSFTPLPYSTPLWNTLEAVFGCFTGSEGKHLFHRIGWKGRIWQLCFTIMYNVTWYLCKKNVPLFIWGMGLAQSSCCVV